MFTIPIKTNRPQTVQGGEHISEEERTRLHGQWDHYKTFGQDLLDYFSSLPGSFKSMDIPDDVRTLLCARGGDVYVYNKSN